MAAVTRSKDAAGTRITAEHDDDDDDDEDENASTSTSIAAPNRPKRVVLAAAMACLSSTASSPSILPLKWLHGHNGLTTDRGGWAAVCYSDTRAYENGPSASARTARLALCRLLLSAWRWDLTRCSMPRANWCV